MKQYMVFVCETCGYESKDYNDMKQHEASHLGLTTAGRSFGCCIML